MKDKEITQGLKTITHVASIFIIPLSLILLTLGQNSIAKTIVMVLGLAFYILILYGVAGGFNWEVEEISRFRLLLFLALSGFYFGIFLYGVWYVVRKFEADMFNTSFNAMKGNLFSGKWIESGLKR